MRGRERSPFGRRVFEARKEAKLTQEQLCKLVGIAQSTLAEAESTAHGSKFTAQIAAALGINAEWLASGNGPKRAVTPAHLIQRDTAEQQPEYAGRFSSMARVPVVGTAKMGDDGYYVEMSGIPGAGDGHIEHTSRDPNAYGLRVRGSSMAPAIRDGWYVVVEPNGTPTEGEYVLVKLTSGQSMVKELLFKRANSIEIMSVNGGERRTIYLDELESLQAVGAVVPPSKWKPI